MLIQRKSIAAMASLMAASVLCASNAYSQYYQVSCPAPSGNFALALEVGAVCSGTVSANTAEVFFDKLTTSGLQSVSSAYTGSQQASIFARFNSLDMTLAYPYSGSTGTGATLNLSIPGLSVSQTFAGADRDASKQLLEDYLKKNNIIGQIMNYQASNTPNSPITGVGGMLPAAVANDFNQNFTDNATNIATSANQAAAAKVNNVTPNLIGVAMQYGSFTALDSKTKVTTIPLSYTWRNDIDPRRQLTFSLPLTQVDVNGAKSYNGGLGVSYRVPMDDNWTLTPAGKLSGVGSVDMATVSGMYTLSLTSTYIWNMSTYDVAMGNMLGYNKTMKFKSGDYAFDPGISSTVLRNGVMISQPAHWNGQKLSVEYSLIDTRYLGGTKLYIDNTQEIGITIGTNKNAYSARSFLRGGLTYLRGKDTKGFTANIGYWF